MRKQVVKSEGAFIAAALFSDWNLLFAGIKVQSIIFVSLTGLPLQEWAYSYSSFDGGHYKI